MDDKNFRMKCQNGCDAWTHPPSKVICFHCQHVITQKLIALTSNNISLYDSIQWPKFPGNLRMEDLPNLEEFKNG